MRVAIVKLSSLGDVIHALPVAHGLKAEKPETAISWIAEVREAAILRGHPDLDAVISVDTRRWRRQVRSPGGARQVWREVGALRRELAGARFDVAIDLQGLLKSGWVTALTRAPLRIGFTPGRSREPLGAFFTNSRVCPPASARHMVEQYCALLAPLGVRPLRREFALRVEPAASVAIDDFLHRSGVKRDDRLIALNPGAGRAEKRWPLRHFRTLANQLWAEAGARVLIVWGPGEEQPARLLAAGLASAPILAPPTDLVTLAALLARCSVVVGSDTGPIHLAAALGTPTVGIYGPTSAERNGPYGPRARALQSADGATASVRPAAVIDAIVGCLQ